MASKQDRSKSKAGKKRHPKYEEMTFRLAQRFGIDEGAEDYEGLPEGVKALYVHFTYREIVRPLICLDKKENPNISYRALGIRYGVSSSGVCDIIFAWIGRENL